MKGGRDEGKHKNPDPRAVRLEASVSCFGLVEIIIVQSSRTEKMSSLLMLSYKNRDWHDLSKCFTLLFYLLFFFIYFYYFTLFTYNV